MDSSHGGDFAIGGMTKLALAFNISFSAFLVAVPCGVATFAHFIG